MVLPLEIRAEVIKQRKDGKTAAQIADILRISSATVRNILRPHGLLDMERQRLSKEASAARLRKLREKWSG